ncbi:hypothetical protein [Actinacidiphila soli]|uniref:hypothetical protein n=1 Tax=Actinacidiphila soli TaxID=2487275 RepID=UPI000FCADDEF|nr:hypothetical protein [Actinacidiphila soli]
MRLPTLALACDCGVCADRTGRVYGNTPIPPDVTVPFAIDDLDRGPTHDPVFKTALAWLHQQPACRS